MVTEYTSFENAYVILNHGAELGRVWFDQQGTEWNAHVTPVNETWYCFESFDEAFEHIISYG